jgi:hypothetical protein
MRYTIIGDVHGHADELESLLRLAGFRETRGAYRKSGETALFVGDLIDRGHGNARVLEVVRAMVDAGQAQVTMGNHELNALHFATLDEAGQPLREHSEKNIKQHKAFLAEFPPGTPRYEQALRWMRALPLWLDLGPVRVVHAYWNDSDIKCLSIWLDRSACLTDAGLLATAGAGAGADKVAYGCVERLLKGPEVVLPEPVTFLDKDGHERREARVRWWASKPQLPACVLVPPSSTQSLPDRPFPLEEYAYPSDAPVLFYGHYWLDGVPSPASHNAVCLDFSVARQGGKLVAYRWDGEPVLRDDGFLFVGRRAAPEAH